MLDAIEQVKPVDPCATRATLFPRLQQGDRYGRELAWAEFHARYAPIIAGFARKLRVAPQDIDDVIQDVMVGFYSAAPLFIYEPEKGRFRGYLKVCTFRALSLRLGRLPKLDGRPLHDLEPAAPEIDSPWDEEWEANALASAIDAVRERYESNNTFRAFEMNVMLNIPVAKVACKLGISVESVYQAKRRIIGALRKCINGNR